MQRYPTAAPCWSVPAAQVPMPQQYTVPCAPSAPMAYVPVRSPTQPWRSTTRTSMASFPKYTVPYASVVYVPVQPPISQWRNTTRTSAVYLPKHAQLYTGPCSAVVYAPMQSHTEPWRSTTRTPVAAVPKLSPTGYAFQTSAASHSSMRLGTLENSRGAQQAYFPRPAPSAHMYLIPRTSTAVRVVPFKTPNANIHLVRLRALEEPPLRSHGVASIVERLPQRSPTPTLDLGHSVAPTSEDPAWSCSASSICEELPVRSCSVASMVEPLPQRSPTPTLEPPVRSFSECSICEEYLPEASISLELAMARADDPDAVRSRYHISDFHDMYKVVPGKLGDGVHKAEGKDGQTYAVKRVAKARLREAEIHLTLDHANIVALQDVFETDQEVTLVLEHLQGGDLFDRLSKRGQFTEHEVAQVMWQLTSAVSYCHERSIAHRDLKLENAVFVSETSEVLKLIDFGLSDWQDPATPMTAVVGSPDYVSPDVLGGSYGTSADMWSLGVLLHCLLFGRAPFQGSSWEEKKARILTAEIVVPASPASDIITKLLNRDPEARLTARGLLQHPWLLQAKHQCAATLLTLRPLNWGEKVEGDDMPRKPNSSLLLAACSDARSPSRWAAMQLFEQDRGGDGS